MKVIVLGLRTLSGTAGGVESHCAHLYPFVAAADVEVEVIVRTPYEVAKSPYVRDALVIRGIWSPRKSGLEAMLHTFLGVFYAAWHRPDILHLHAIGPAVFTPLARLLGLKVVVTHHGFDYLRPKWGPFARFVLKTGERMAMRFATKVISVSRSAAEQLESQYHREVATIPNGVPVMYPGGSQTILRQLGIEPRRYVLHVGRVTAEKRQDDLIRAFSTAALRGWKLVIVGDAAGTDPYSLRLREMANANGVVLAGFRDGEELCALLNNAGCFALPSTVEGFSIALLEALSAGCPVVASDIPANHEIELPGACYFPVGDIRALADALIKVPLVIPPETWEAIRAQVREKYDWSKIAIRLVELYREAMGGDAGSVVRTLQVEMEDAKSTH